MGPFPSTTLLAFWHFVSVIIICRLSLIITSDFTGRVSFTGLFVTSRLFLRFTFNSFDYRRVRALKFLGSDF